ncbi:MULTISPECIES: cache domain-containing sensor histidine kinase [Brevibacillus]|uniref:cache domain-containing sensor histidine kinase n=1 Tax=Brevibacillus TaxID=55080 RepID=UPI00156BC6B7|nr:MULTISPECIES: sensor histidine kinase [Brevibacillus]MDH6351589.1 two-component system sensor histidine kinase YesM [Brevibacillus sp. 1238]MED2255759.1 sensor histidine kinase [Brevibacillus parabrevis]NRQ55135.1 sensor histidine kinase [Brevibacillus sp. HD1.4A]UED69069.1 sensor histidine kinase [Brevibacillus sp. HD3.3A]WDV95361.1 sensor histidine kinase [Brevibacillus parabrevis]
MKSWLLVPRRSIHAKLLACMLIAAIIPLFILGSMAYWKSSMVVREQFGTSGEYIATQLQIQIDNYLSQMRYIAYDINTYLSDPTLIVMREEQPKTYAGFLEQKNFERFLGAYSTQDTKGIFIVTPSGYFFGKNVINGQDLQREQWWKALPAKLTGESWIGFYTPRHYVGFEQTEFRHSEKVLGLVVPVLSGYGVLKDSRILIEMKAGKLFQLFQKLEDDMKAYVTITDENGRLIYQTAGRFTEQKDDIVWNKPLESNNWMMQVRLPYEQMNRSADVIGSFFVAALVLSAALAVMLAYLFSRRITGKIRRLEETMRLVGTGELQTRATVDTEDELGRLGVSFNQMVRKIQTLVAEVSKTEQLKKEAELRAVHYQINPHLLFNTLNSIQWKARLSGANEIGSMLYHLIKVLEGNLDISQELVPLEKELKTAGHFLEIQQFRYGPVFSFEQDGVEACSRYLIPRMTLQPLLENIFFHAFEDGEGIIRIAVQEEAGIVTLLLRDDGAGIEPQRLAQLLDPELKRSSKRGLGVFNVDQKFKLHFGKEYGLNISSVRGAGTTIQITWPKREEVPDEHQGNDCG